MDSIRRVLGVVWILLGLAAGYYFLISQAIPQFQSNHSDGLVPAIIYTFVLTPIITGGLIMFGVYSLQGEYDRKKIDE